MTKEKKILYAVAAVVAIAIILLLARSLTKNKMPESTNMEIIKAKDETIQVLKENQVILTNIISDQTKRDSILAVQSLANQPKYIINERSLQNVPVIIRDLSKDELRRRAIDY